MLPHCPECRRPCCRLETLVLQLDWRRLHGLWGVRESRRAFDLRLARGEGPPEIRSQGGLYYAYQRVCPAFDPESRRCRVYEGDLKPPGCTDFPVYLEEDRVTADLRCEAVDPDALEARLRDLAGPRVVVEKRTDRTFPFLVSFRARRRSRGGTRTSG